MYNNTDHTFVIPAYKESEYLDECVESLMAQEQKSSIIIATSTPNSLISGIAEKHGIELRINNQPPSISGDWNFAYKQANTRLITLAHQDDIYLPDYLTTALEMITNTAHPIIFFSHYAEIVNNKVVSNSRLLRIKRKMLKPLKYFDKSRFIRRRVLSFGSPISCPSVMYVDLKNVEFSNDFICNLDWSKWEELSKQKGSFVYCEKPLIYHRVHQAAETANAIRTGIRRKEDYIMFRKFWCMPIAKILANAYKSSENEAAL